MASTMFRFRGCGCFFACSAIGNQAFGQTASPPTVAPPEVPDVGQSDSQKSDAQTSVPQPERPVRVQDQVQASQPQMQLQSAAPAPLPPVAREPEISGFSFIPRLGIQLGGSGTQKYTCSGNDCTIASASIDFGLKAAAALGADFLFKLGDLVRIGPGLLHTHIMDVKPDGATSSHELGTLTDIDFIAEFNPKVSRSVWLTPRLQLGVTAYHATGLAKDAANQADADCRNYPTTRPSSNGGSYVSSCTYSGLHSGYHIAAGFGAMFPAGNTLRFRIDALYDYLTMNVGKESQSGSGVNLTAKSNLSGTRFLLLAGLEI